MNTNSKKLQKSGDNSKTTLSLILFVALLFMPFMGYAQGSKTDFSGNWKFNETKSKMGERGPRGGGEMTITQNGNNLTINRTFTGRNGEAMTNSEKFTLDGKESVNEGRMGSGKSMVNFSTDGKTLIFQTSRTSNRNGETREMKSNEKMSMPDKNTLEIISTMTTSNGERTTTAVYDRK
jgi:hypothetical protein